MPDRQQTRTLAEVPVSGAAPSDDIDNELRTLVTVSRAHKRDVGERQVFVRIDGGERTALRFGESFTREIAPGSHRLRVHNTLFWKTLDFTVEPGEHLEFIILNHGGRFTFSMAALLGSAPLYLKIYQRSIQ